MGGVWRPSPPPRPEQTPPVQSAADTPSAAAAAGGDTAVWDRLIDHYKGRLSVKDRVFLNMASGVVEGDCLTVLCQNDFVKDSLDHPAVLSVLREVTAGELGHPVRVRLEVGSVPKSGAKPATKPVSAAKVPPSRKAAVSSAPVPSAETPPWEEAKTDALDELAAKGQQLEHFKIK